jgi:hypothetical protein
VGVYGHSRHGPPVGQTPGHDAEAEGGLHDEPGRGQGGEAEGERAEEARAHPGPQPDDRQVEVCVGNANQVVEDPADGGLARHGGRGGDRAMNEPPAGHARYPAPDQPPIGDRQTGAALQQLLPEVGQYGGDHADECSFQNFQHYFSHPLVSGRRPRWRRGRQAFSSLFYVCAAIAMHSAPRWRHNRM